MKPETKDMLKLYKTDAKLSYDVVKSFTTDNGAREMLEKVLNAVTQRCNDALAMESAATKKLTEAERKLAYAETQRNIAENNQKAAQFKLDSATSALEAERIANNKSMQGCVAAIEKLSKDVSALAVKIKESENRQIETASKEWKVKITGRDGNNYAQTFSVAKG